MLATEGTKAVGFTGLTGTGVEFRRDATYYESVSKVANLRGGGPL